jgi:hypothetical protein
MPEATLSYDFCFTKTIKCYVLTITEHNTDTNDDHVRSRRFAALLLVSSCETSNHQMKRSIGEVEASANSSPAKKLPVAEEKKEVIQPGDLHNANFPTDDEGLMRTRFSLSVVIS